jgi:glutathione S-transferase
MRARMALRYAGIDVEIREISLKEKPPELLAASPKATVPVLILSDGSVIDESLDIMRWALKQHDPDNWLIKDSTALIEENDSSFKRALDRYKYAVRFPEHPQESYRAEGELFLAKLEQRLQQHAYLFGDAPCMADIAIFPFIRQFAGVNSVWFEIAPYPCLRAWLNRLVTGELFLRVMEKQG